MNPVKGQFRGSRLRRLVILVLALALPLGSTAIADTWEGALERGGPLRVDPETRRASRGSDGRPMWDGVHRLDDGSTVIIRDGIAVPTRDMLEAWQRPPDQSFDARRGACEALVARTCGRRDECALAAACLHARRLLSDERAEQRLAPYEAGPHPATATSDACLRALADEAVFPACSAAGARQTAGACSALLERVCGTANECAGSEPCRLAGQLAQMAREALQTADEAELEGQCKEALTNPYFEPCD